MWLAPLRQQSIAAQLTLLVAVSALLGIVLTVAIVIAFLGRTTSRTPSSATAARIAKIVRMAQAEPAEIESVIAAARRAGIQVERLSLNAFLARQDLVPALAHEPGEGADLDSVDRIAVPLDDEVLLFETESEVSVGRSLAISLLLVLTIALTAAGLVSGFVRRRIVAPLSRLATTADTGCAHTEHVRDCLSDGPREIAQIATVFVDTQAMLRSVLAERTRMLAAMSHDLRAPLTRLQLRAERAAPPLQQAMMRDLRNIAQMLDETLELVRHGSHAEPVVSVDIAELLRTIADEFADIGHRVSYQGPMRCLHPCRPSGISRAITNLIDNATKYGTSVILRLEPRDAGLQIEVLDDGPGIPPTLRERAFEPFVQIEPSQPGGRRGVGLGLSIARDVVRSHGGTIELLDGLPRGLLVRIGLPADV